MVAVLQGCTILFNIYDIQWRYNKGVLITILLFNIYNIHSIFLYLLPLYIMFVPQVVLNFLRALNKIFF